MIPIPDWPYELSKHQQQKNFYEVFEHIHSGLKAAFGPDTAIYTRKTRGFFAWKRHNLKTTRLDLYYFWLLQYDEVSFRLSNCISILDITAKFWPPISETGRQFGYYSGEGQRLAATDHFELSFIASDMDQIASPDLVRYVESIFDHGLKGAYPWPLFCENHCFPHYAWTSAGQKEQDRRFKLRNERARRKPILR
jgi:hypothetical protein